MTPPASTWSGKIDYDRVAIRSSSSSSSSGSSSRTKSKGGVIIAMGVLAAVASITLSHNNVKSLLTIQLYSSMSATWSSSMKLTSTTTTTSTLMPIQFPAEETVLQTESFPSSSSSSASSSALSSSLLQQPLPPIHYNGKWVGNHWMPSSSLSLPSYHLYTPEQLTDYWKDESVLVIGDSTARRMYATMYELLYHGSGDRGGDDNSNHHTHNNNNKVKHPDDLRVEDLDAKSIIDRNKKFVTEPCDRLIAGGMYGNSSSSSSSSDTYLLCRTMPGSGSNNKNNTSSSNTIMTRGDPKERRFDFACIKCISEIAKWFRPPPLTSGGDNHNDDTSGLLWQGPHGGDIYDYTVIVIVIGPWEMQKKYECPPGRLNNTQNAIETLDLYAEYVAKVEEAAAAAGSLDSTTRKLIPPRIVWRTWAGLGQEKSKFVETHTYADQMNTYMKKHIDDIQRKQWQQQQQQDHAIDGRTSSSTSAHCVSYMDWGHIMKPRTFPVNVRISGDISAHNGLEARIASIQALTNHAVEQDRQLLHNIPPWSVYNMNHDDDYDEYHCRTASPNRREEYCSHTTNGDGSTSSSRLVESINAGNELTFFDILVEVPLTADDQVQYHTDQQRYCQRCMWDNGMTCKRRLHYLLNTYGGTRHVQLHSLLEKAPQCVKKE